MFCIKMAFILWILIEFRRFVSSFFFLILFLTTDELVLWPLMCILLLKTDASVKKT